MPTPHFLQVEVLSPGLALFCDLGKTKKEAACVTGSLFSEIMLN
jgi:hypothetical protein